MTTDAMNCESHTFQAEVSRLLHLMVHAVYTDKDIFLRELISNASDACDKLRYEAIGTPELLGDERPTRHPLRAGQGRGHAHRSPTTASAWTSQELVDNLGTIARSGTRASSSKLDEAKEGAGLIGQFGVGFYSAFMVADHIEVTSRKAGSSEVYVWRSNGADGFTIAPADPEQAAAFKRGTEIRLISRRMPRAISSRMRSSALSAPIRTTFCFPSSLSKTARSRARSTPRARSGSARNRK